MTVPITTTLNAVCPCLAKVDQYTAKPAWDRLLEHLGKTEPDDEPLKFSTILEATGRGQTSRDTDTRVYPAYECLHSLSKEHEPSVLRLMADVAESVLPIFEKQCPDDKRPREAIQATRDYADGKITQDELKEKRQAANKSGYNLGNGFASQAAWSAACHNAGGVVGCAYLVDVDETLAKSKEKARGELLIKRFG